MDKGPVPKGNENHLTVDLPQRLGRGTGDCSSPNRSGKAANQLQTRSSMEWLSLRIFRIGGKRVLSPRIFWTGIAPIRRRKYAEGWNLEILQTPQMTIEE